MRLLLAHNPRHPGDAEVLYTHVLDAKAGDRMVVHRGETRSAFFAAWGPFYWKLRMQEAIDKEGR